ncbi:MAG: hypothetical protein WC365_09315 [Candidatus Babeliales bacterium]
MKNLIYGKKRKRNKYRIDKVHLGFDMITMGGLLVFLRFFFEFANNSLVGQIFYYVGLAIAFVGISLLGYEALHPS